MKNTEVWCCPHFTDEKADRLSKLPKCHGWWVAELGFEPGAWALSLLNWIIQQYNFQINWISRSSPPCFCGREKMFIMQVLPLNCVLRLPRKSWFAQHKTGRQTGDPEDLGIGNKDLLDLIGDFENLEVEQKCLTGIFLLSNFVWLWRKILFYLPSKF